MRFKVGIAWLLLVVSTFAEEYCGIYNCYELLNVARGASQEEIKKNFRELTRKYHPDKKEGSKEIFQQLNSAYQILISEHLRYKYNLYLDNPHESEYYREYRYYKKQYQEYTQLPLSVVLAFLLLVASAVEYVAKKHTHEKMLQEITESQDFKMRVNQATKGDRRKKEEMRQKLLEEVHIEGCYGKPTLKRLLWWRVLSFPFRLVRWIWKKARHIWKYWVRREEYDWETAEEETRSILRISEARWKHIDESEKKRVVGMQLWKNKDKLADLYRQR